MSEWISVEERLPDNQNQRVLVTVCGDCMKGSPKMDTDRYTKYGGVKKWVRYNGYVTHWMPLPEPPKEG